ncbi:MAG: hypothetical protein DI533_14105 [Cereibacter sphaeroides]|uniref:Terminase large subunit gp17-like C-terminal domain-containing protein n=1 Tax=Cereibacter sphaeroides TaxID=1063 RepID=A0A2W5UFE0_CERSP|nr:MAG: hypothetical protein DI533_14105 [Cereibacter sphaeroides]
MSDLIEQGEKLILRSSDPAVEKVTGYRRFLIGFDIAQADDPAAFCIIQDSQTPYWLTDVQQALRPRRRVVVAAERLRGASYPELARIARNLTMDPSVVGRSHLVADATGVGRAWVALAEEKGLKLHKMQITSGEGESETREHGRLFYNVGKNRLLGDLNSALHTGALQIGQFPLRDEFAAELDSFQVTFAETGRAKIEGGTKGGHADMAMACSQALWLSDHSSLNCFVGQSKLAGWFA